jgi:hypothetical protein
MLRFVLFILSLFNVALCFVELGISPLNVTLCYIELNSGFLCVVAKHR